MPFRTQRATSNGRVRFMVAAQIGVILHLSVSLPASASCTPPAYQECFHLQSDVEGMLRVGDARYMGRYFGNLDFQCTTESDVEDAKAMIRSCASLGEWTSTISVAEAQDVLDRVIRPNVVGTSVPMTQVPESNGRAEEIELLNAEAQRRLVEHDVGGANRVATIRQEGGTSPAVETAVRESQASPVAPSPPDGEQATAIQPVPGQASRTQTTFLSTELTSPLPWYWIAIALWLLLVLIGIIAGWRETIIVFRNYDDLAMVFFMMVVPLGIALAGSMVGDKSQPYAVPSLILAVTILAVFLAWVSVRTWHDQVPRSVWAFALAFITKMSLGILFVNAIVTVVAPGGKSQAARARARSSGLAWLAVLTPVVMRLVRHPVGIWSPRDVLSPHQRRRAGI